MSRYSKRKKHRLVGIGARMCRLRNLAGIRSTELALLMEVDLSMPSHWEVGYSEIRLADAVRFCDIVGCSLDAIARGPAELLPEGERRGVG